MTNGAYQLCDNKFKEYFKMRTMKTFCNESKAGYKYNDMKTVKRVGSAVSKLAKQRTVKRKGSHRPVPENRRIVRYSY